MAENQEISKLNIYQKLSIIRKNMEVLQKTAAGYGYNYVPEDEILAKLHVQLDQLNLLLIPDIVPGTSKVTDIHYKKTKVIKGEVIEETVNEVLVSADMHFTWLNVDNPDEKVTVNWTMTGQQSDASQAFGSGLTYCIRYFLLKYFNIATTQDDPDAFRSKQKQAEEESNAIAAQETIKELDAKIKGYVAAFPANRDAVVKLVCKYVKSGDYTKIKEPLVAAKLYEEFSNTFLNTQEEK